MSEAAEGIPSERNSNVEGSAGDDTSDSSNVGVYTYIFTPTKLAVETADNETMFGDTLAKLKPYKDSGLL